MCVVLLLKFICSYSPTSIQPSAGIRMIPIIQDHKHHCVVLEINTEHFRCCPIQRAMKSPTLVLPKSGFGLKVLFIIPTQVTDAVLFHCARECNDHSSYRCANSTRTFITLFIIISVCIICSHHHLKDHTASNVNL